MADTLAALEVVKQGNAQSSTEKLVLFVHGLFTHAGFRVTAVNDQKVEAEQPQANLPANWNTNPSFFSFEYKHIQSAMTFIVKLIPISSTLLIHALAVETDKVHTVELKLSDYANLDAEGDLQKWQDLCTSLKIEIIQNLVPGVLKEGYESAPPDQPISGERRPEPREPRPLPDYGEEPYPYPYPPRPDYDDDPLRIGPPRRPAHQFPHPPFGVGDDDLGPPLFRPPGSMGGGMTVGPHHPGFQTGPRNFPHPGPGNTRLPPGSVPPGARFDPFGPPMGPSFPPDPDHERMPGFDDDMYS